MNTKDYNKEIIDFVKDVLIKKSTEIKEVVVDNEYINVKKPEKSFYGVLEVFTIIYQNLKRGKKELHFFNTVENNKRNKNGFCLVYSRKQKELYTNDVIYNFKLLYIINYGKYTVEYDIIKDDVDVYKENNNLYTTIDNTEKEKLCQYIKSKFLKNI